MKICTRCQKPGSFHKNSSANDGLQSTCKSCFSLIYYKNIEKRAKQRLAWRKSNLKACAKHTSVWQKANPSKAVAKTARHKSSKLRRTPKWLTATHLQQMELFYVAAALLTHEFGVSMQVDHIVPLQGKYVSGLHVPWNLQVLSASENRSKGNSLISL